MKQMSGGRQNYSVTHLFIYILAMLLLWEWLRPIPTVTNTSFISVFVMFAFFSGALIYLRMPLKIIIPVIFAGSVFALHYIFGEGQFFSSDGGWETFKLFLSEAAYNLRLIFSWDLAALTDFFRTFLLLLLMSLICYLLYFWLFHTKKVFFFLLATVIYITVLDTFTPVDASMAIIRIVVIGFFMLSLLHMLKIQEEEKAIGRSKKPHLSTAWMYTLILMILVAAAAGYAAPKYEPQWADPVPSFNKYVLGQEGTAGGTMRRVGYGENDERLGGGFVQDHATVFYAEAAEGSYWRGESKNEYTGHGWRSDPELEELPLEVAAGGISNLLFEISEEEEQQTVTIEMENEAGFSHFFYPGQMNGVHMNSIKHSVNGESGNIEDLSFFSDGDTGKIAVRSGSDSVNLTEYMILYEEARFNINDLMELTEEDPSHIRDMYLQLPDTLPDRVTELAEEIVAEHDNRYDQVKAVESYFGANGFRYETSDVPVPGEDEDYVDQFLFETQYGYCDNFSTAMTVMLRAVDIPARWVKGYTEGEEVETLENGRKRYEIKNSNAHSWVEVYFPGTGWVPFEPTQGFSNNTEFYEEEEESAAEESAGTEDRDYPEMENQDDFIPPMEDYEGSDFGGGDSSSSGISNTEFFTMKSIIISVAVLLLAMLMYRKQNLLVNFYFTAKYRLFGKGETFASAYERLLWILENEGLPRAEGETLREYAVRVDRVLNSAAMAQMTAAYERVYYGGKANEADWEEQRRHWEELVKSLKS
ncbi:transglutaminase TgpA family protein [Evansella clarkii]|uniref:transglutaminase TgpA family protein n=1 Tax=Evansella clarkii TaxID=79879 RepID=UPI000998BABA|nr:transglutaminaseTgpA domain-containing protein [Evansella clarkii]